MRQTCFSNWKTRGFCVDECPQTEVCMEDSSAVLPPEVWRLVSMFEPRLRLDSREKTFGLGMQIEEAEEMSRSEQKKEKEEFPVFTRVLLFHGALYLCVSASPSGS